MSTESPTYQTVRAEQAMKIFVLPKEKIYIEGFPDSIATFDSMPPRLVDSSSLSHSMGKKVNQGINIRGIEVGDILNLTCVSGASKPPPKMAWFINGDMVSHVLCYRWIFSRNLSTLLWSKESSSDASDDDSTLKVWNWKDSLLSWDQVAKLRERASLPLTVNEVMTKIVGS